MANIDEAIERGVKNAFEKPQEILGGRSFNQLLAEFHAGEIVPVVRCRDCKHRDPEDKKCDCGDMTVQGLYFPRPDTWYCPNGERKEDEHGNSENP